MIILIAWLLPGYCFACSNTFISHIESNSTKLSMIRIKRPVGVLSIRGITLKDNA